MIIPDIIAALTVGFLAFTKNFYVYNINLILFFCFVSIENPVLQGYLLKTIPSSIKGIGVGFDMLLSTFLGKISGPIIYGFLADKYEKKNYALAWQICISYFFIGVIIIFFLFYFKIREVDNEKSDIIILEENIITTLRTFSDENDLFNIEMARLNKSNAFL